MKVHNWIEERRSQLMEDVATLVRIQSVSHPGEGGFPFGIGCHKVLQEALAMAERHGLMTENCQSYCGTARIDGEEKKELGIFSHLDVVPEGEGWTKTEPYCPAVLDGWLYGRGSADNKGACVSAMYALRYLKEFQYPLRHTIRQYFGCDEERGMEDIEYYLKHHNAPVFSIVPDAAFPVCYGEKGRYKIILTTAATDAVVEFVAGEGENSVPGYARIVYKGTSDSLPMEEGIQSTVRNDSTIIEAYGLAAHAAKPESGKSALHVLMKYLKKTEFLKDDEPEKLKFLYRICSDYTGSALGISCQDEDSGGLTVVGSLLESIKGRMRLHLDIRYPATEQGDWILDTLKENAIDSGWEVEEVNHSAGFSYDKTSYAVQCLTDISNQYQKTSLAPFCMSGGTYARKLPNAVGYGPGVSGQKKPCEAGHGYGHQPDECVCIDNLVKAVEIYVEAIITLDRII